MREQSNRTPQPAFANKAGMLSVQLSDRAVNELKDQRGQLEQFIRSQLKPRVDFDTIPGTSKPTLLKPGAEKLANLFKLGSRIVNKESHIDLDKNFAMFSYTMEIFHIPTDKAISQCEGSANSKERAYSSRTAGDIMNTLQKMAQKRAYVGAVIMAVGASDFFTHDLEDMDSSAIQNVSNQGTQVEAAPEVERPVSAPSRSPADYVFPFGQYKGLRPPEVPEDRLRSYLDYLKDIKDQGPMIRECISALTFHLSPPDEQDQAH